MRRALSTAPANSTLVFASGKTYKHTASLNITVSGLHLTGTGTLLATNQSDSALEVKSSSVTIDGGLLFKFNTSGATRQSTGWQTMIFVDHVSNTVIRNITVDGSPSTGIMMFGASNYTIDSVTVQNTLADGIHNTDGSHDGIIKNALLKNVGDDGVAVVSYVGDGVQSHDITVQSPRLYGQTHGRAFTVVGGYNVTYSNFYADSSNAAALYVASEPSYNTYGVSNVKYLGGTLINSNSNSSIDHGAILVYNGQPSYQINTVDFENITIQNTRTSASRQVGLIKDNGAGTISGIQMRAIGITNGPSTAFFTQTGSASYNTIAWTFNGSLLADHIGFTPYP